ncbi:hypothetical protein A2215_01250 [Candidatus Berkelbacteria bacterium RIFOXYA2_FULL_43_10]|uniref:Uncharacterized protein n=1 Tax=Candidatus Berkelbacteria bacterium RIFOXYA2_FULL_43_10 TaxID=1797472 RepID=A0A1F5E6E0_9BACT|nr:MAG: hypothetical protein A2215_01250 [Candidatus Berkelbacteria bacterium RIFOXYA2_FULL_43_10]
MNSIVPFGTANQRIQQCAFPNIRQSDYSDLKGHNKIILIALITLIILNKTQKNKSQELVPLYLIHYTLPLIHLPNLSTEVKAGLY